MSLVINYNTYLQLSPLFRALAVSSAKKGRYSPKKSEVKNEFIFDYKELNMSVTVPIRAVLETNNKLNGILGIKFISSTDCPSHRLGTCQVPEGATCYGIQGERQSKKKGDIYGLGGMSGDLNGRLCSYYWDLFKVSARVRLSFFKYCEYYEIEVLRFNNKGDFRDTEDIHIIYHLAKSGVFSRVYGYTARDDLYGDIMTLSDTLGDIVRVNGSNVRYNNRFFVTDRLEDMVKARYICRGDCAECGNCRNLNGETIFCFVHGSGSDTVANNEDNREFLRLWSRSCLPWDVLRGADYTKAKGLLTCVNKALADIPVILRFGSHRDLINFIRETEGGKL